MEPESALITKLHAKLSHFRRERDEALRRKELAVERARIVRKDRENAAGEVRAMQTKLVEMREETKRKIGEVDVVEREVESLTMEVSSYLWRIGTLQTNVFLLTEILLSTPTPRTVQIPTLGTNIQTRKTHPPRSQTICRIHLSFCLRHLLSRGIAQTPRKFFLTQCSQFVVGGEKASVGDLAGE